MKIRVSGLIGKQHSWSYTVRSIALEFYKMNHDLFIHPTDGCHFLDKRLLDFVNKRVSCADLDFTYTLPKNFKARFNSDSKVKASIFNYESSILPDVWKNDARYLDYIFPSSMYCKEIFINAGWDRKKVKVVPLGIDYESIRGSLATEDFNDGKFNFLNISIPHYRKNIDVLIEGYYRAFQNKDDVRLILKTSLAEPKNSFECFVPKIIHSIQNKLRFTKYPSLTLVTERYDNMGSLYKGSDCLISTTGSEGFGLPMLEAMASETLVASTCVTGHKDFISKKNAVIIPSKKIKADKRHQYWRPSKGAKIYRPNIDDVSDIFSEVYNKKDELLSQRLNSMKETSIKYSWKRCAENILKEAGIQSSTYYMIEVQSSDYKPAVMLKVY